MSEPKWIAKIGNEPTRYHSTKQEKMVAKKLSGKTTINSGATLGQNDVITDNVEVECKTTSKDSFTVKYSDWEKLRHKCGADKMPIMVFELQKQKKNFVLLSLEDYEYLTALIVIQNK